MPPVNSRLQAQRKAKLAELLPKFLEERLKLVSEIKSTLKEEERKEKTHRIAKNASFKFFCAKVEFLMRNGEISQMVGVSKETFEKVMTICRKVPSNVPHSVRISIFLKFCREGLSQRALSRDVGLSQPTLSRIIQTCIHDIVAVASEYIKFPTTKEEIRTMEAGFFSRQDATGRERGVPCFAVLDGKHWRCDHPPHTGSLNYNYKCFFSFNSLFLSDYESRIIYVQMSSLGVNSDAQMFRDGPLKTILDKAAATSGIHFLPGTDIVMPSFILADNGFALSKAVVTPYRANQLSSSGHLRFNELISGTRVKIENLFGILTSKFQIFSKNLRLDPKNSRALIVACAVMHNISLGPLKVSPDAIRDEPILLDPYKTPENQRSALKLFMLNR